MIRLRPHHLLCTQSFEGKGYSSAFAENMNQIVTGLRQCRKKKIQITLLTDDLCSACPSCRGANSCVSDDKVLEMDRKVLEYFGLEQQIYRYREAIAVVNAAMTPELLEDICGTCQWYPVANCRSLLLEAAALQQPI